jgi:hypothetical protein
MTDNAQYTDPFMGKCVHGVAGGRIEGERTISPDCEECQAEQVRQAEPVQEDWQKRAAEGMFNAGLGPYT